MSEQKKCWYCDTNFATTIEELCEGCQATNPKMELFSVEKDNGMIKFIITNTFNEQELSVTMPIRQALHVASKIQNHISELLK